MPHGPGFGVEVAQLQQVARLYDGEGAEITAVRQTEYTGVGAGQVGRAFTGVASPYQQAFGGFGSNLTRFGQGANHMSATLGEVATGYEQTEHTNRHSLRGGN